ncbi:MAG: ChbG/HpnK family deacetylase, partial [Croceitalea sp.]|nr:ChbG/HpnK family deacetylase [Croceitalea sp.]
KKALAAGINVTHLDAHMGAAMSTPALLEAYIKLGQKYELPVLLDYGIEAMNNDDIRKILRKNDVVVNRTMTALPNNFDNGFDKFYSNLLKNIEPGLNCLLIHLAYDDEEMKAVTIDHPDWGAAWRQADFDFFTSDACQEILREENIILVSWLEIRDKIVRANKN